MRILILSLSKHSGGPANSQPHGNASHGWVARIPSSAECSGCAENNGADDRPGGISTGGAAAS